MKIAVIGCGHGVLDEIYDSCAKVEEAHGFKLDLLLVCGDFQAVRNEADLQDMACPSKYRSMNQFYQYYSGEKRAPILTLFVGGNHEASNHLLSLFHGGWVAPNIFFMGQAGVYRYGGVRIAGMSGIYKSHDFKRGHFERPPLDDRTMRSAYHCREYEMFQLLQIHRPIDIFVSHDWPRGIARCGDTAALLRRKSFLRDEIEQNTLGNPASEKLLHVLKPDYWFSAHMHVKFAAIVRHPPSPDAAPAAAAATAAADDAAPPAAPAKQKMTRFLALGKCLPNHDFLQIIDVEGEGGAGAEQTTGAPLRLEYDEEWLAIVTLTHRFLSLQRDSPGVPSVRRPGPGGRVDFAPTDAEIAAVRARVEASPDGFNVPLNFAQTVPAYNPSTKMRVSDMDRGFKQSPQTSAFLSMLGLPDVMRQQWEPNSGPAAATKNDEEIDLDDMPDDM